MIITVGNRHEPSFEELLNQLSTDDPEELPFAIEGLKTFIEPTQNHMVVESLKERVQTLQSRLDGLSSEGKTLALGMVTAKIQELAQTVLKLEQNPLLKAFLKLKKHGTKQIAQESGALQLYTPLEGRSDFDSKERFDAFTKVVAFLKDASRRCLLLMGDAGAGKTTFSYFLAQSLWQAHAKGFVSDQPIPVLIPLITIKGTGNLISEQPISTRSAEELPNRLFFEASPSPRCRPIS